MTKEETIPRLQAQYDKVVEQNRELQQELREKTAECEELKQALDEIEKMTKKDLCLNCEYHCEYCDYRYILDIIKRTGEPRRQKAKDGKNDK